MQDVTTVRRRALSRPCRGTGGTGAVRLMAIVVAAAGWPPLVPESAAAGLPVRIEATDGSVTEAVLESLDQQQAVLDRGAGPQGMPLAAIRRLGRQPPTAEPARAAAVQVTTADGAGIGGDDFLWEGETAVIVRAAGRIELPIDLVKKVAWGPRPAGGEVAADGNAWLAAVPAEPVADLIAVTRADGFELVECAITGVSPEAVTVVLDGDRIPVKRAKVLGLVWVRPATAGSGSRVTIAGGSLTASTIEWTAERLVLDGVVRIPGGMLEAIDYAAGRTVSLATLEPSAVSAEPFFGALAAVDGLAAFFAPRLVPTPGAKADGEGGGDRSLLMRPRSRAVWIVPAESRRFRTLVVRAAEEGAEGGVQITVLADDKPVWEQRLDAAVVGGLPIDVDVAAARRLSIVVDFLSGDMGGPVRFDGAVFEK